MSKNTALEERVKPLQKEVERLKKVNEALMRRVEQSTDAADSKSKVKKSPDELVEINRALEREIGEHKKTEDALRWERNFMNAVLNAADALVVVLDRKGRIVRFNRACERICGYAFEEVEGKAFWDLLLVPEEVEKVEKRFERLLAGEFSNEGENYWVTKSGERRLITWSNTTLNDADGEVEYVVAIGIDITDAREAEQKLNLYKRVFMASSDAILIHNHPEKKIIAKNPAYERISGYSDEEHMDDHIKIMIDEDSRKEMEQSMKETGTFRGELKIQAKDGTMYYVDVSEFPITDDAGDLTYSVAIARDVTERKQAEEKLKLYRRIFMASSDGISITDSEGGLIECNPALRKKMGCTHKECLTGGPLDHIREDDAKAIIESLAKKGRFQGEICQRSRDGRVYIVDLSLVPIRNDDNDLVAYVGIGRDITERKHDQEALATRLRYETGLAACSNALLGTGDPDAVVPKSLRFLLDAAGAGRAFIFENFEDPSDGLCTRPRWEVCAPGVAGTIANPLLQHLSYDDVLPSWRETLAENKAYGGLTRDLSPGVRELLEAQGVLSILLFPIWVNEEWYGFVGFDDVNQEREWGEDSVFEYEVRLLHTTADMIGGYLARHQAVEALRSSLKELEQAHRHLKDTQTQLVQAEKMASLGTLVAGIAHEINTPIGSVNSMHDTLMRATAKLCDVLEEECAEDSPNCKKIRAMLKVIGDANRVIRTGTERVTTIVRRLRSFARLDEAELKEADIHEGLEDTLMLVHHELKHTIQVNRNYGEIPRIPCYLARLNQVFVNLLINAKHAIHGKGEITIATYERAGNVYIEVTDTGVGIPKDKLNKIFDPGYTTKSVGVGTGLGLSICYQIMQEHHGEIRVESEVGEGTTFTLVIPTNLDEILGVS